jgi:hypothetical protein
LNVWISSLSTHLPIIMKNLKPAHKTAVCLENLFHDISMERTVEIYRMLGDMGFGRKIVGIFKKSVT